MAETGRELYELLIRLTGLDRSAIESELNQVLIKLNLSIEKLTEQDIRRVVAAYLLQVGNEMQGKSGVAADFAPGTRGVAKA